VQPLWVPVVSAPAAAVDDDDDDEDEDDDDDEACDLGGFGPTTPPEKRPRLFTEEPTGEKVLPNAENSFQGITDWRT